MQKKGGSKMSYKSNVLKAKLVRKYELKSTNCGGVVSPCENNIGQRRIAVNIINNRILLKSGRNSYDKHPRKRNCGHITTESMHFQSYGA